MKADQYPRSSILCAVVAVLALQSFAQGQLTWGQAILIHLHGPGGMGVNLVQDKTITVPTGRVWKIESVAIGTEKDFTSTGGVIFTPYQTGCYVTLDKRVIAPALDDHPGLRISPIWLPAGTYTLDLWDQDGYMTTEHRALISAIEFIE